MDAIPWDVAGPAVAAFGGWSLALYFVRLVFSGKMVPKSIYDEQRDTAASWREAYETERDARRRVLEPMAQLQKEVLTSIPVQTGEIEVKTKDGT